MKKTKSKESNEFSKMSEELSINKFYNFNKELYNKIKCLNLKESNIIQDYWVESGGFEFLDNLFSKDEIQDEI